MRLKWEPHYPRLIELVAQGLSASDIAEIMSTELDVKVTRCAIVGALHRAERSAEPGKRAEFKLAPKKSGPRASKSQRSHTKKPVPFTPLTRRAKSAAIVNGGEINLEEAVEDQSYAPDETPEHLIGTPAAAILSLRSNQCRYMTHPTTFCGKNRLVWCSYCLDHAKLTFRAVAVGGSLVKLTAGILRNPRTGKPRSW